MLAVIFINIYFLHSHLPNTGRHSTNALPVMRSGQLHIGMWLTTLHTAVAAQVPGQGSVHLFRIQALLRSHSKLCTHSGRHPVYGSPMNSGRQLHCPLLHSALFPHGDGLHGSSFSIKLVNHCYNTLRQHKDQNSIMTNVNKLPLGGMRLHCVNALPVKPSAQEQIDTCFMTWQLAFNPQEPGHGSLHFWLMQARLLAQSSLIVHSGLQFGGLPSKFGKQEHDGLLRRFWHCELGPHGEGTHGSLWGSGGCSWTKKKLSVSRKVFKEIKKCKNVKY